VVGIDSAILAYEQRKLEIKKSGDYTIKEGKDRREKF